MIKWIPGEKITSTIMSATGTSETIEWEVIQRGKIKVVRCDNKRFRSCMKIDKVYQLILDDSSSRCLLWTTPVEYANNRQTSFFEAILHDWQYENASPTISVITPTSKYIDDKLPDDQEYRKSDRVRVLVRRQLLIERLPPAEWLKDSFLEDNMFDESCMIKGMVEDDNEELEAIEKWLKRIEDVDGPPTEGDLQQVKKTLDELEEYVKDNHDQENSQDNPAHIAL